MDTDDGGNDASDEVSSDEGMGEQSKMSRRRNTYLDVSYLIGKGSFLHIVVLIESGKYDPLK